MEIRVSVNDIDLNTVVGQRVECDEDGDRFESGGYTIADAVVEKITKDLSSSSEYRSLRCRVAEIRDELIRARCAVEIERTFAQAITKTNIYGEPTGQTTMSETYVYVEIYDGDGLEVASYNLGTVDEFVHLNEDATEECRAWAISNEMTLQYDLGCEGAVAYTKSDQANKRGEKVNYCFTAFVNLTPHVVRLITEDGTLEIAPSGSAARVAMAPDEAYRHRAFVDGHRIRIKRTATTGTVVNLPEPRRQTAYIVSKQVIEACPTRFDLMIPYDTVRSEDGTVIGCRSLARPEH